MKIIKLNNKYKVSDVNKKTSKCTVIAAEENLTSSKFLMSVLTNSEHRDKNYQLQINRSFLSEGNASRQTSV